MPLFAVLSCQPNQPTEQSTNVAAQSTDTAMDSTFQKLFEEVNVVKMHFFGTQEAAPSAENYPYVGTIIGEDGLKFLETALQPNEVGSVYACYRTENNNFYVLRVPGKYASSDLVMAKWDPAQGKLVKIHDLASLHCDEGLCHQQDAWFYDLDDNRKLELVIKSHTKELNSQPTDEQFTVLAQDEAGNLVKADEKLTSLAIPANFVLHKM